jgi:hypothetical protein
MDVIAPLLVVAIIVGPFGIGDREMPSYYRVAENGQNGVSGWNGWLGLSACWGGGEHLPNAMNQVLGLRLEKDKSEGDLRALEGVGN